MDMFFALLLTTSGMLAGAFLISIRLRQTQSKEAARRESELATMRSQHLSEIQLGQSERLDLQNRLGELLSERASLAEKAKRAEELKLSLAEREKSLDKLSQKSQTAAEELAYLRATNSKLKEQLSERSEYLKQSRDQLNSNFEHLAQKILDERVKKLSDTNHSQMENFLSPLHTTLQQFQKRVDDQSSREAAERISLKEEIKLLRGLNHELSNEAKNLSRALKGDQKLQGHWGELILEKILESSGLTRDREYEVQVNVTSTDGSRLQPDVIIRLPENKDIVIDSKVSLTAYERYHSAVETTDAETAIKDHINSVKSHIRSLSRKNYDKLPGITSPDFVLMFMPVEAAFLATVKEDPKLFMEAYQQNIVLVSPTTLLITLRTIHNIWRHEYQNQNAQEIAKRAGDLYDKFVGFTEAMKDVGDKLEKAQKAHTLATERLSTGHGNLVKRAETIRSLGVKTKKSLSAEIIGN